MLDAPTHPDIIPLIRGMKFSLPRGDLPSVCQCAKVGFARSIAGLFQKLNWLRSVHQSPFTFQPLRYLERTSLLPSLELLNRSFAESHFNSFPGRSIATVPRRTVSVMGPA